MTKLPIALTSPHARGKVVKDIQFLLQGHGPKFKHAFYRGARDGEYGPATANAVRKAKWALGYPKSRVNGTVGERFVKIMQGKQALTPLMRLRRRKRLAAARKAAAAGGLNAKVQGLAGHFVGTVESPRGSNSQMFGRWYGLDRQPWCAIFVSYVLTHSGRSFRYSYVPTVAADARAGRNRLRAIPYSAVQAALKAGHPVVACFDWPGESPGTPDHIGFVSHVIDGSSFATIEGNTSLGNQSNGGAVMLRKRNRRDVQAFVRARV